jgi:hypothetical protein
MNKKRDEARGRYRERKRIVPNLDGLFAAQPTANFKHLRTMKYHGKSTIFTSIYFFRQNTVTNIPIPIRYLHMVVLFYGRSISKN